MLYLGFAIGVWFGGYRSGLDYPRFAIAAVILLVAALIGSRVWYIVGHRESWLRRAGAVGVNDFGAGLYGGLVLSLAVSWPVLRLLRLDFWRFWDGAAVIILVSMAVTRVGCLMNGCCSGRESRGRIGVWLPDDRGEWKRRYPTQLFESAWAATILVAGVLMTDRSGRPGLLFLGSAAAYGLGRLVLETLRADASKDALPTRMNMAFSAMLVVVSVAGFILRSQ